MARTRPALPSSLIQAACRFQKWRRMRTSRCLPPELWKRAVCLAGRYGVHRTAQALRLNYAHLKERLGDPGRLEEPSAGASAAFLELAPAAGGGAECVLELERPDGGKMRMQLKGAAVPDLTELSRAFWERRA